MAKYQTYAVIVYLSKSHDTNVYDVPMFEVDDGRIIYGDINK